MKRSLVGLATMVLPRMELDHVEEWIRHHVSIGVTHFWIWLDREWHTFQEGWDQLLTK